MKGHEPLYLADCLSEADLFREFNGRDPYYRHIAARAVQHLQMRVGIISGALVIMDRNGGVTRALEAVARNITIVEHRSPFLSCIADEFAASANVITAPAQSVEYLGETIAHLARTFSAALCVEQASLLQPRYPDFVRALASRAFLGNMTFLMTLGPSHHRFAAFRIADYRSGEVKPGEIMSELSHPIHQAVQREVLRIVRERHGYTRDDVWPPAAKAFDLTSIREANEAAGFRNLAVVEETFAVPGTHVYLYGQNGWTSFFRWSPLADLPIATKIAILREAIETVRARSEYDEWCGITAHHPVAFVIASMA